MTAETAVNTSRLNDHVGREVTDRSYFAAKRAVAAAMSPPWQNVVDAYWPGDITNVVWNINRNACESVAGRRS